jgi:hypothetical protein
MKKILTYSLRPGIFVAEWWGDKPGVIISAPNPRTMKKSRPHLQRPNIDASNTGLASPGDGNLALSVRSTPTQPFTPHNLRERLSLTTTSGKDSAWHDLSLRCSQPLNAPPQVHNMTQAAPRRPRRVGAARRANLCCQAMMRFSPAWEADCPDIPSSKYQIVATDRRILRV